MIVFTSSLEPPVMCPRLGARAATIFVRCRSPLREFSFEGFSRPGLLGHAERHFQFHRLAGPGGRYVDGVAGVEAAEGQIEIVEAGDFAAAEFDDHVAAFEAGFVGQAAGAHALDGVAFHLAAEVRAAALAFNEGVPFHFDVLRRGRAFVGVGHDLLDQVDDAVHARDVDLGPLYRSGGGGRDACP